MNTCKLFKVGIVATLLFSFQNVFSQNTYTTTTSGQWSDVNIWSNGGAHPTSADLISGLHSFVVAAGHNVVFSDSANAVAVTINGKLTFGKEALSKNMVVRGALTIGASGEIGVSAFEASHTIAVGGGIVNNGTMNLRNNSAQNVNIILDGNQSIGGSGAYNLNNLQVKSGTIDLAANLNIDGSMVIEGGTFNAGTQTISIAGSFSNKGKFNGKNSIVNFDGSTVQNVTSTNGNDYFGVTNVNGGGYVVFGTNLYFTNNFTISNNSTVTTCYGVHFYGDFTVEVGSKYEATAEWTYFSRGYAENNIAASDDGDQTLQLDGDVQFYALTLHSKELKGNPITDFDIKGTKTIKGNITVVDQTRVWNSTRLVDDASTYEHKFASISVFGKMDITSHITLTGGTLRRYYDQKPEYFGEFSISDGADITVTGSVSIAPGDIMVATGNVNVETGYILINGTYKSDLDTYYNAQLVGQADKTLAINNVASLYIRAQDGYPSGFGTINIGSTSYTYYDSNFDQVVRGGTYGHLSLSYKNKTVDGPLVVNGSLNLNSTANEESNFYLGTFNHSVAGNIVDNPDNNYPTRRSHLISQGEITMAASGSTTQYIYCRNNSKYEFNNLTLAAFAPTAAQAKYLNGKGQVTIGGKLEVKTTSTNDVLYLALDLDDEVMLGDGSDDNTLVLNNNCRIRTSSTDGFKRMVESFASVSLQPNSYVQFDRHNSDQIIPGDVTYGNLALYGTGKKTLSGGIDIKGWIASTGYTPVLVMDNDQTISISGDWKLATANVSYKPTSQVIFNGENQSISGTTLPNVILSGSDVKTLNGTMYVNGNLTIGSGVEFNADNRYIYITGNWTSSNGSLFHQRYGRLTMTGEGNNQIVTLDDNTRSPFYDFYITKLQKDTVVFATDIDINCNLITAAKKGNIVLGNHTLSLGGDFYLYAGCDFIHTAGALIHMNGAETEQLVRNYHGANTFPAMRFSGAAIKRLYDNTFDIDGDFTIDRATVNAHGYKLLISGNWVNNGGSFLHSNEVVFDGADQLIDNSDFYSVRISGTGAKKLNGHINLTGALYIDPTGTLDVSPNDGGTCYNITLNGAWRNNLWDDARTQTGTFIPRDGTVFLVGNNSQLYTGDSLDVDGAGRAGKAFNNLVINKNTESTYVQLYPVSKASNSKIKEYPNDLTVLSDFTIKTGIFYAYWNHMAFYGNVINEAGNFNMNAHYTGASENGVNGYPHMYLRGAEGEVFQFDPGPMHVVRQVILNNGAKYNLMSKLQIDGSAVDSLLWIKKGELCLNHNTLNMNSSQGQIHVGKGGVLTIDSDAVLGMYNTRTLFNKGGRINLIGTEQEPARIEPAITGHYYKIVQTAGVFAAKNYKIEGTRDEGVLISGGSIDPTNNFSDGTFANMTGTAMMTLTGLDLGEGITINNLSFTSANDQPKYNIVRTSGNGTITFANYSGTRGGASYEKDCAEDLIRWSLPDGYVWTNASGDKNWHNPANWSTGQVPTNEKDVILDNSQLAVPYEIIISQGLAQSHHLTLNDKVTLTIAADAGITNNGLEVFGDLTMKKGSVLNQNAGDNLLKLHGSWSNVGNYVKDQTSVATMYMDEGLHSITLANSQNLANLVVDGTGGILTLSSAITITGNVTMAGSHFNASNNKIYVGGDWTVETDGDFEPDRSIIYFNNSDAEKKQVINGGNFYDVRFQGAATKEIATNLNVKHDLYIENGAIVDGKTNYIFMSGKGRWYNYVGPDAFDQTGGGTVVFSGAEGYIGLPYNMETEARKTKSTRFNNLWFQGTSTKYCYDEIEIKGNLNIYPGTGFCVENMGSITGVGTVSQFNMTGGEFYIHGYDNFPKNISSIDLSGGTVRYSDEHDQVIQPADYYTLYVYNHDHLTYNGTNEKTLLGDITVRGSLYVNDSLTILNVNNYTITLTGGIGAANKCHQIKWGDNGTVVHVGAGWGIDSRLTDFCNIEKQGTGNLTAYNNLKIAGNLILADETNLNMQTYTIKCVGEGKTFKIGSSSWLYSYVAETEGVAFPEGFTNYEIAESNTTYIRGASNQTIFSGVEYGNLILYDNYVRTIRPDGNLHVRNTFRENANDIIFDDNGFDLFFGGATNEFRQYQASGTVHFIGDVDQTIYAEGAYTSLNFKNVEVGGSGTKEFNETNINIAGNLTINEGSKFSTNDNVFFSGERIVNNGQLYHYGSVFNFCGEQPQTINAGTNNIYALNIAPNSDVTVLGNGFDIGNGTFTIGANATLDMGALSHTIASAQITLGDGCNWRTELANLTFDRAGDQDIPALTCQDIHFATSNTKWMNGDLVVNNLIVDEDLGFRTCRSGSGAYTITVNGSWENNGTFYSYDGMVLFESPSVANKTIKTNSSYFNVIKFNQTNTQEATFAQLDQLGFKESMTIGRGAKVKLNSNTMIVGDNDPDMVEAPYVTDGESIVVEVGGELDVNERASLLFNQYDGNTHLDVYGKLTVVGSSSDYAIIGRSVGYDYRGTEINIHPGGEIAAKYYHIQYLAPQGLVVMQGARVNNDNNFSYGIWSNMFINKTYTSPVDKVTVFDKFYYLDINIDYELPNIVDVVFNHGGTPTVGYHYNVKRDENLADAVTFDGEISGILGGETYECDLGNKINWPAVSVITWTGKVSSDWFNPQNWQPAICPDREKSVVIPMATNAPAIYKEGAECKDLTLTNGMLSIERGISNFDIYGSVTVGDGGVFSVEDDVRIKVANAWTIASHGHFIANNSTISFEGDAGNVNITPRKSNFNNVEFNGGATFSLIGTTINFDGDFTILSGKVTPATSSYTYNIKGNYLISGEGQFNSSINTGWVKFCGTNQSIVNGNFNRVKFSESGTKTLSGTFNTYYTYNSVSNNELGTYSTLWVDANATLSVASGCELEIKGNVLIDANATFDDGGNTHHFRGYCWAGAGNYVGSGTIVFDGGTQYLFASNFHNLEFGRRSATDNQYKYLRGDINVSGNLSISSYYVDLDVYTITGTGVFDHLENARVYAKGADNYPKFSAYTATSTSYTYYTGAVDQTIRAATYGYLYLNSTTTKTLEGDITVLKDLKFNENGGTLNAANSNIYIGQNWDNRTNGKFVPGTGTVFFNGNTNQYVYLGSQVENPFYDINISQVVGATKIYVYFYTTDVIIRGSLTVNSGNMYCYNGYNVYLSGDMMVIGAGGIYPTGIYHFIKPNGECMIRTNGSKIREAIINGANCSFKLADDLEIVTNFTLQAGKFYQNGCDVRFGDGYDNVNIYGKYYLQAGEAMRLSDQTTVAVKNGGFISILGTESNFANIASTANGRYFFVVEKGGTIAIQYYSFSNLAKTGVLISQGAVIDNYYNFSNGVFTGMVSGGACIDIRNNQEFYDDRETGGNRIENVSFPQNPGGGCVNIKKTESSVGRIEMFNATGLLSGAKFENDTYNLIDWTGDVTLTWTGARNDDWFNSANWTSSDGADRIPDEHSTAVIPRSNGNVPTIRHEGAVTKGLNIETNGMLFINNSVKDTTTLTVLSDVTLNGTIQSSGSYDNIDVYGNWSLGTTGSFIPNPDGLGTISILGVGAKNIQQRNSKFNNLYINNNGIVQLLSKTAINGNLTIEGGTLDVTSSNYEIVLGGNLVNKGSFVARSAAVTLTGVNGNILSPGSSSFYNLNINSGNYQLASDLHIDHFLTINAGSLSVTGKTIYLGDGTGTDKADILGKLYLRNDATMAVGANAAINVLSGGLLSAIGQENNEACFCSQENNKYYSITINSGGEMQANYYKVTNINVNGIYFKPGAVLSNNESKNLSNGQFIGGQPGGQYLTFENDFSGTNNLVNLFFNKGPRYNVSRNPSTTTGVINIVDAIGVVAGYYFENDNASATTGAVVWTYTSPTLYWVGGNYWGGAEVSAVDPLGNRWDNANNWDNQQGGGGVPNDATRVFIPDVSAGSNVYPVLADGTDDCAQSVDVFPRAKLTIGGGMNLNVINSLSIAENATLIASDGIHPSTITIGAQLSNNGHFDHGGSSTVVWKSSVNRNIEMNGDSFYNFEVNNVGASQVTFTLEPGFDMEVENNFVISGGTVDCNGTKLIIGGDFVKTGGVFRHGRGTVQFSGTGAQQITSSNDLTFYNLIISGSGTKTINPNITILGDFSPWANIEVPTADVMVKGGWLGSARAGYANNFHGGTGKVIFCGTSNQSITKAETFTNLVLNSTASTPAFTATQAITITNSLELVDGVLKGNTSNPVKLMAGATVTGASQQSYINGKVEKVGSDDFVFPIGSSDRYAPIGVSGITTATTLAAQYFNSTPSNIDKMNRFINRLSGKEYWTINRTSGSAVPKVSLYWLDSDYSEIADVDVISVSRYNETEGEWQPQGEQDDQDVHSIPEPGDYSAGYVATLNAVDGFGAFTFGYTYPTIKWDVTSSTTDYEEDDNWIKSKPNYVPNSTTNILVPAIASTQKHPIITNNVSACYDLVVEAGGIFEIAAGKTFTVHGNASIAPGATLILGDGSSIVFSRDVDAGNATIVAGHSSTVKINSEYDQLVAISECYNIAFSGGKSSREIAYKTLASDVVVNGSLSLGANTYLYAGANTINLYGNWSTSGRFECQTSTLVLCGTTDGTPQTITETRKFYNLIIHDHLDPVDPRVLLVTNSQVKVEHILDLVNGIVKTTAGKEILMETTSTLRDGGKLSYIDGVMQKTGSADFVFPIGSNGIYAPIGIWGLTGGTSTTIAAQYSSTGHARMEVDQSNGMFRAGVIEYWSLSRSGSGNPYVTLYWQDTARSQISDHTNLCVAVAEDNKWKNKGRSTSQLNGDLTGFVKSSAKVSFVSPYGSKATTPTPITFGSLDADVNPLPIELVSFNATARGTNDALVEWETATEHNNHHFSIEHRFGSIIDTAATVASFGDTETGFNYSCLVLNQTNGTHYYRLLQTDNDGTTRVVSNWASLTFATSTQQANLSIVPNPGKLEQIRFTISGVEGEFTYTVCNAYGATIISKTAMATDSVVELSAADWNLTQGAYIIMITTNSGSTTQMFVVQ